MLLTDIIARAGGGGSGGGGGGGGIIYLPIIIVCAIVAWWRRRKQISKAKQELFLAEAADPTWDTAVERAKQVFIQFQQDWSDFNLPSMKTYLTASYFEHIRLMMLALQQMNRQNKMSDVNLISATMFNVSDSLQNDRDDFDIEMTGLATDQLIDLTNNQILLTDKDPFTEVWHFDRQDDRWMLAAIEQVAVETAIEKGYVSKASMTTKMQLFADKNGFFYNADFGWLLLPTKGLLFSLSSFGLSDINYHVIGQYHGVLVQFYQYVPIIERKHHTADYFKAIYKPAYRYDAYIVAQAILPKEYGDIVVKHKGVLGLSLVPPDMTSISLEGVDFNKEFLVYATDAEKVTSLELLSPSYMEKLLAAPFEINIEIVDNVLYLYSTDEKADFDTMLVLLQTAFEEMKM